MSQTRYRPARTLVRRLCRLPEEDRAEFKRKIARLRKHFERFNVDASELCQWIMGLRKALHNPNAAPNNPASFGALGDFLLDPRLDGVEAEETERDRWRLAVFDDVAGIRAAESLAGRPLPENLAAAMRSAAALPRKGTADRLFPRLRVLEPAHRLVLLKSAAEWIVARYQRGVENWVRQHAEWKKEKNEWEKRHESLTPEIRDRFTGVFKALRDPQRDDVPGVRRKNPRICPYERIRGNLNNCIFAGEKGHAPLCWKYEEFLRDYKASNPKFNKKFFPGNVEQYLNIRARSRSPANAHQELIKRVPQCKGWFEAAWNVYLKRMGLQERTVLQHGRLPHCLGISGKTYEKSECEWNPHTELCKRYKVALDGFDADTLRLEPVYREWRRSYLAGPRKPSFRYPSSRELPMPKVFGDGFHEIDFGRSVLRLRLDDMAKGQWLEFGFVPWPRGYRPSRKDVQITSVHVHFVGSRPRAGFRFDVAHKTSRFTCSQDEIDELRSRTFPRKAQDRQFLEAARKRLHESFSGDFERELRLLAVDLGEKGACAAVYQGRAHEADVPLEIVKINRSYDAVPDKLEKDSRDRRMRGPVELAKGDPRGVCKEHVGRHLERIAADAKEIAAHRRVTESETVTLGDCDLRGLKRHVAWMIRDWVRHNAARIVAAAEQHCCDLIVFESLRNQKVPGYDQLDANSERDKRQLAMLSWGRLRHKVREKAVERGMRVVTVPEEKSSQVCSACGHVQRNKGRLRKNKSERKFECECGDPKARKDNGGEKGQDRPNRAVSSGGAPECNCNARLNSDANAARVLARIFRGEIDPLAAEAWAKDTD